MTTATFADGLEYQRLEHRAHRMAMVLAALEDRAIHRQAHEGGTPAPLLHAIRDFKIELAGLRRRMRSMQGARAWPARRQG